MALQAGYIGGDGFLQGYFYGIWRLADGAARFGGGFGAGFGGPDGGCVGENAFGEEEADGQIGVLARGAHGHGYVLGPAAVGRTVFEADLQGFFYGYRVLCFLLVAVCDLLDRETGDAGSGCCRRNVEHISKLRK